MALRPPARPPGPVFPSRLTPLSPLHTPATPEPDQKRANPPRARLPAMAPSSKTTTPYAFAQPGIASVSSSSAPSPSGAYPSSSSSRSPYGQQRQQQQHARNDSSGRSSALPLASTAGSSSTTHLLAQRSSAHVPYANGSSTSLDMPSSTYSPRAGGAAPLLAGYGHQNNGGGSSSSSIAGGGAGRGPFYEPDFERLADSTSSRGGGGGGASRNGSFAAAGGFRGSDGGRGSISSLGSVTSMGYTPRAQVGMYDAGSIASHASSSTVGQQYALGGDPSQWARSGSPEPDGRSSFAPSLAHALSATTSSSARQHRADFSLRYRFRPRLPTHARREA